MGLKRFAILTFFLMVFLAASVPATQAHAQSTDDESQRTEQLERRLEHRMIARARDFHRVERMRAEREAQREKEREAFLRAHENDDEDQRHLQEAYVDHHPPVKDEKIEKIDADAAAQLAQEERRSEANRVRYVERRERLDRILEGPAKIDEGEEYDVKTGPPVSAGDDKS